MINTDIKKYNFFMYSAPDAYGQTKLSDEVKGSISMAIYNISTNIQNNVKYKEAEYIGLTKEKGIKDTFVIDYGEIKLKVLYTIPSKRKYTQVFLKEI